MARAKVMMQAIFEMVDCLQQGAGPGSVPTVDDIDDELFDELAWTLD